MKKQIQDKKSLLELLSGYDKVCHVHEEFLEVWKNGRCGVFSASDAELVVPIEYDGFDGGFSRLFVVTKAGKQGVLSLLNYKSEILLEPKYDSVSTLPFWGSFSVQNGRKKGSTVGDPRYHNLEVSWE